MTYSPYNDIKTISDAKSSWGNASSDEERQRHNDAANKARQNLTANGYGYLADQLSADGADAATAKKILDAWAPQVDTTTGNFKTGVNNPAYNQEIAAASKRNDTRDSLILSDHANVNSKYDDIFGYANSDLTQTDEYKSAYANIMPSYNLAAMQGRDNEVAVGAASNGGNIDSFAAANAMRQQSALTAKGQALAHQIGLDAVNARVNNARGILSDLGVYNSGVYSALNEGVNNSRGIANDIFNNSETAKNNQVSRDIAVSEAAGELTSGLLYQLPQYSQFFNPDGTLKNPDIDFKAEIQKADAAGNTGLATALRTARGAKIWGDYAKYGQHDDGDYLLPGSHKTANYDLTSKQIVSAENIANANNAATLDQISASGEESRKNLEKQGEEERKSIEKQGEEERKFIAEQAKYEPTEEPHYSAEFVMDGDEANMKNKYDVDYAGLRALNGLRQLANDNGGVITMPQIIDYLVTHSSTNETNKGQLTNLCNYLGLGTDWLRGIENANPKNYKEGVVYAP